MKTKTKLIQIGLLTLGLLLLPLAARVQHRCVVAVDVSGDGTGFDNLYCDTVPGDTNMQDSPAKWTCRAICRVDDANAGQWNKPVSITVEA